MLLFQTYSLVSLHICYLQYVSSLISKEQTADSRRGTDPLDFLTDMRYELYCSLKRNTCATAFAYQKLYLLIYIV